MKLSVLTSKNQDIISSSEEVVRLGVRGEGARGHRRVVLHPQGRRPALEPLHEIGWHSRQLPAGGVRRLREAELRQEAFSDHSKTVLAGVFVRAAGGARVEGRRRLLRTGEIGSDSC